MILTETANFLVGTGLFIHTVFKAIVDYVQENKLPCKSAGRPQVPDSLPSIIDIKRVLPKKCFQPELSTSFYYTVKDFLLVIAAYAALSYSESLISSFMLRAPLIILYWAAQGTLFMALFVMGHDCGHGSYSNYQIINDIIGTVSHGVLMVPYYQWKLSHRHHHKNTGNIDKDEIFYPVRRSQHNPDSRRLPGFGLGLGWIVYLTIGYNPRPVKHLSLREPMFAGHVFGCLCSLVTMATTAYFSYLFYASYGFVSLIVYYIVPLFLLGSYIVVVTFLHHADVNVPWYADDRWDFVRGQLSTVDRHYGFVHEIIHNIGTHQMHHMFPAIPHYHLEEATTHFRQAFPQLVRVCNDPILPSFVRMFQKFEQQSVVDDDTKICAMK